jgi:hypothetical protein
VDLTGTLKNEIFRPLTTTVVPGVVAVTPYVFLLLATVPGAHGFRTENPEATAVLIGTAVLAAGLIIEDVGSFIEFRFCEALLKRKLKKKAPPVDLDAQWNRYLRLKVQDELVGQRFLRTLLVRLKFELSMAPALAISLIGLWRIQALFSPLGCREATAVSILGLFLIGYLLYEAYRSVETLWETREEIIAALEEKRGQLPE